LNICRGLFNNHKLIFSFCIASKIERLSGEINYAEWNLFLRGVLVDGDIKNIPNPDKSLMTDKTWKFLLNLECISHNLEGVTEKIDQTLEIWRTWIKSEDPSELPLPNNYDNKLTEFQKVLLYKGLRPEKISFIVKKYVEKTLGKLFSNPMPVIMEEVYKDSDNKIPIIFVLTVGADP